MADGMEVQARQGMTAGGIAGACACLLGLLALTVAAARLPLGRWNLILAMGISAAKAAILAWFFMDLRRSGKSIRLFAWAGLFLLLLLAGLAATDYLARVR